MDQYKELLTQYLSFKSISTDAQYKSEIDKILIWLTKLFQENKFTVQTYQGKTTNPVFLASFQQSNTLPTVLIYGHYDVQPAQKEDGWQTEPFDLVAGELKWFGRGVVDNKGQNLIHILSVFDLIREGNLAYNVKFLLEGNEETGNPDLAGIIRENKDDFAADLVLISDGEIIGGNPTIDSSLRGGGNLTLTYKTARDNVHSGIYGGAIPNAAHELSKLLGKLYDDNQMVTITGFYDNVNPISEAQRQDGQSLASDEQSILNMAGVKKLLPEPGNDFYTQTGLRPTLQVTGLKSGYIGEGYANIVPFMAEARINFRFVLSQKAVDVIEKFKKFVKDNTPDYVQYDINVDSAWDPVGVDITSEQIQKVKILLSQVYGLPTVFHAVGGSIPVVMDFKKELGIDALMVPLANDDCHMHGADENYDVSLIQKGLEFSRRFFAGEAK